MKCVNPECGKEIRFLEWASNYGLCDECKDGRYKDEGLSTMGGVT